MIVSVAALAYAARMNAKKVRAAVADITADSDPTHKAAKLASLCSALPGSPAACRAAGIRYLAGVQGACARSGE
jgi:hypothetical protein